MPARYLKATTMDPAQRTVLRVTLPQKPDPVARAAQRTSSVAKVEPSPAAQRKAARKRTDPHRKDDPDDRGPMFFAIMPCIIDRIGP
jgi:hypothetical protein